MRSTSELNNLFITQYQYIRMKNCIGCNHDKPSQKHHITCLTDVDREFFIMKTLAYMLNRKFIDKNEFKYLNESYTTTMDDTTFTFLDSIKSVELSNNKKSSSL